MAHLTDAISIAVADDPGEPTRLTLVGPDGVVLSLSLGVVLSLSLGSSECVAIAGELIQAPVQSVAGGDG